MLFNSLEFAFFLLLVLVGHYLLIPGRCERGRKLFLLGASYFFYAAWNPPFVLLLWASTLLDFVSARRIEASSSPTHRRLWVIASLAGNLGMLGYFKYGSFVLESLGAVLAEVGVRTHVPAIDVILPVGISFYTFQSLSYTLDVYRRDRPATRDLADFALYVSFFPQLVAGPIVRSKEFLPQLEGGRPVASSDVEVGILRITTGLVKKVVFADGLGRYVDLVFADPGAFGGANIALAFYAYAFQIYFDFSGYTDIAIGLGRLFGIRLPENFNRPFLAVDPRDFWRRWHISLSTWLRDYLYVSLGGNRSTRLRTYRNLAITMLLGGLWHGAAWTFVAWGAIHGGWLILHRVVSRGRSPRLPRAFRQILTFHGVCMAFVVFRSESIERAGELFGRILAPGTDLSAVVLQAALLIGTGAGIHVATGVRSWRERVLDAPAFARGLAYGVALFLVFVFSPATERFIYFQF